MSFDVDCCPDRFAGRYTRCVVRSSVKRRATPKPIRTIQYARHPVGTCHYPGRSAVRSPSSGRPGARPLEGRMDARGRTSLA